MGIKKQLGRVLTVLLTAVLTVGCGGRGSDSQNAAEDPAESGLGSGLTRIEADQLYMGEYIRLSMEDAVPVWEYQVKRLYADACDGIVYILAEYRSGAEEEQSRQFFLATYAYGMTELAWEPFQMDLSEREGWFIRSMAAPKEGELSFRVTDKDENGEFRDFLVVTDLQGNQLSLSENLPEEKEYPWNSEDAPSGDHVARGADGSIAACMRKEGKTSFYSYDPEGGKRKEIKVSAEISQVRALYPEGNQLYYVDNRHLFRWDQKAKKLTDMMSLGEINFPVGPEYAFLLPGGQGKLLLCALGTDMLQVFCLSEEEYQPEDEIRMAVLYGGSLDYTLNAAVEYSYAHWNCPISTEKVEEDEEAFRNRVMAQIAAGEGPDLMLVSAEDMMILAEKGALLDLAELIPEETREQLFPCVIEDGTVDGKLVGMTMRLWIDTMLTADDTWPGDSWNLDEFLQLLDTGEEWERPIGEYIVYIDPMRCLKAILPDICHSRFLDIDEGMARFDSEEFIRILEICRQYEGRAEEWEREDPERGVNVIQRLIDGEYISRLTWIMNMSDFAGILTEYEGKAHLVGYPAEDGGHFAWNHFHYVVVNVNTEHKEEIKDFFGVLLDHDRQLHGDPLDLSIRRDAVRDSVVMVDGAPKEIRTIAGQTNLADPRYLKPDGSTYMEEFLEFLDSCRAAPKWPPRIEQMIEEELTPYFKGDKSVEEAVALLQNRVQLYLDE